MTDDTARMRTLRTYWRTRTETRVQILMDAAMDLALEKGWREFTRRELARRAGYSMATVTLTFGDMHGVRREVMKRAVEQRLFKIVLEGLAAQDPVALGAPLAVKKLAMAQALS